ncbi:hypothetical protein SAY86_007757 [Trapa natans]|uniref:Uncharacterized protein n=1 Tax=Trapa natans TaxID=22666 RepID=A0AAN7LHY5_TRANT|nr:hypothetical protein SAY86_007757 [Trapa natans]
MAIGLRFSAVSLPEMDVEVGDGMVLLGDNRPCPLKTYKTSEARRLCCCSCPCPSSQPLRSQFFSFPSSELRLL